jgi:antagonist of KipI
MIEVVRAGLCLTVQDLGRPGLGRFGVSPGGAMDPLALRVANRLVGNADGAAALELTGPGVELRFLDDTAFAVTGADLGAMLDGHPLIGPRAHATAGARLVFGQRTRGARAMLAVAGGIDVPRILGSASADLDAGLGRRLGRGQWLAVGDHARVDRPAPQVAFAYADPFVLRFVPGDVARELVAAFVVSPYTVSDRSNRTGYRLAGAALPVPPADGLSQPIAPGTIQLPPDGQPILLMADRQTVGGYLALGQMIAADRPKAAQLWPGDVVRFQAVSLDQAHAAARRLAAALEML